MSPCLIHIAQIREDRIELERLLSMAQRARVKDLLTIDLRKLDTEYSMIKDKIDQAKATQSSTSVPAGSHAKANSGTKTYDFTIKTYCKYFDSSNSSDGMER